jgi:hypothetical protein
MRNSFALILPAAGLVALAAGCATTSAPMGWLPEASSTQTEGYGAWIAVKGVSAGEKFRVEGEFIAVDRDTVFILSDLGLVALPRNSVTAAKLTKYYNNIGGLTLWTVAGIVGCASHGLFALISAPLWLIVGVSSTAAQSYKSREKLDGDNWDQLAHFARFPQGMPAGVDREALRPKYKGLIPVERIIGGGKTL